ncbi:PIG-L family deacetylase [Aspergillus fischeri NRRL 181]|uniref:N-acetylglucosaminylphosphatidylinositol deacetylase n=1 Tax=Neosartorya fischeri (strain ATCC 1020 / DSM 3700 / CBS 544.65 / FGSC A1164 / JCM 1740 / NRRL 181 / WB 181) TaxID=331117 RepID=A1DAR3_NEOFI|nr:GlcNAc-PI de-N-acetylase, putative [Aspergillus fischeri NRRL 181]EAW19953.1 GlcNAc-PI de-N-acetylase, putative [Aspergillus fischeri NRRL 181]
MKLVWIAQRLGRQGQRRKLARIASSLFFIVALTALCLYILLAYYLANDPRLVPVAFQEARSILLVTAHPDDETLFFSPSITYRREDQHVQRALLVISSGDYDGIGERRRQEIHDSCSVLGIVPDRCVVLDNAELQDNPKKWWDGDLIKGLVASHVQKWNVDLIITFDDGGVSGHINHRAVSAGVRFVLYLLLTPNAPPVYTLQSTFLLRKYSSLLDLISTSIPFSWRILKAILTSPASSTADRVHDLSPLEAYNDKVLLVSPWRTYLVSRAAFTQHASQYSWDRSFYLVLSRYMWFNNLNKLVV